MICIHLVPRWKYSLLHPSIRYDKPALQIKHSNYPLNKIWKIRVSLPRNGAVWRHNDPEIIIDDTASFKHNRSPRLTDSIPQGTAAIADIWPVFCLTVLNSNI